MTRLVGSHFLLQGSSQPRIKPETLALQAGSLPSVPTGKPIIFTLHNSKNRPQGSGNRPALELVINCIWNNKGDTNQTYFKMIVGANRAILQVTCPLPPPVHSWNSRLKTLIPDQQGGAGSLVHYSSVSSELLVFSIMLSLNLPHACLSVLDSWVIRRGNLSSTISLQNIFLSKPVFPYSLLWGHFIPGVS